MVETSFAFFYGARCGWCNDVRFERGLFLVRWYCSLTDLAFVEMRVLVLTLASLVVRVAERLAVDD